MVEPTVARGWHVGCLGDAGPLRLGENEPPGRVRVRVRVEVRVRVRVSVSWARTSLAHSAWVTLAPIAAKWRHVLPGGGFNERRPSSFSTGVSAGIVSSSRLP